MAQRRKFSDEEKLNILLQASQKGVSNVVRQYNISYSIFAKWKQNFQEKGIDPFTTIAGNNSLKEENILLKKIIADQALSLELKDEELQRLHMIVEKRIQQ